jgi:plastocyanin
VLLVVLALTLGLGVLAPLSLLSLRREADALRSQPALTLEVSMAGMRFEPAEIHVPAGKVIRVDLINRDSTGTPHDFQTLGQHRDGRVVLWAGERGSTLFTAADKPGRYPFICTIRGHSAAGMNGTIVVD